MNKKKMLHKQPSTGHCVKYTKTFAHKIVKKQLIFNYY